jgi:hypothetical protein
VCARGGSGLCGREMVRGRCSNRFLGEVVGALEGCDPALEPPYDVFKVRPLPVEHVDVVVELADLRLELGDFVGLLCATPPKLLAFVLEVQLICCAALTTTTGKFILHKYFLIWHKSR